jgi:hypothetical protein
MKLKVVGAEIPADHPTHGQWVECDAPTFRGAQAVMAQATLEFRGRDKLAPVMRSTRQPSQHIFGANDGP